MKHQATPFPECRRCPSYFTQKAPEGVLLQLLLQPGAASVTGGDSSVMYDDTVLIKM